MKIIKNKKSILITLVILVLIGISVYKLFSNKHELVDDNIKCEKPTFFLGSYTYSPNATQKHFIITTEKELEQIENIVSFDDALEFDFKHHDYLIFFIEPQLGCGRTYEFKCFRQEQKEIYLDFAKNEVDNTCDAIFTDSIIIEIEKDKYDSSVKITTNIK